MRLWQQHFSSPMRLWISFVSFSWFLTCFTATSNLLMLCQQSCIYSRKCRTWYVLYTDTRRILNFLWVKSIPPGKPCKKQKFRLIRSILRWIYQIFNHNTFNYWVNVIEYINIGGYDPLMFVIAIVNTLTLRLAR